MARISGPLLDRIDLQVEVPALPYRDIEHGDGESSATLRARVQTAIAFRERRGQTGGNATVAARDLRRSVAGRSEISALLEGAVARYGLSARATIRILRVARTIADLAGAETIGAAAVAEAIQYRALDLLGARLTG